LDPGRPLPQRRHPIRLPSLPKCDNSYNVDDSFAGKKMRCQCGMNISVPTAQEVAVAQPAVQSQRNDTGQDDIADDLATVLSHVGSIRLGVFVIAVCITIQTGLLLYLLIRLAALK
jgi:hypothetical protein